MRLPDVRRPGRSLHHVSAAIIALVSGLMAAGAAAAVSPNGRLQIIQLDVGQGDGALLITASVRTVRWR